MKEATAVLFIIIGAGLCLRGLYLTVKILVLLKRGIITTGTIIDYEKETVYDNDVILHPIIEFKNEVGNLIRKTVYIGSAAKFNEERVELIYIKSKTNYYEVFVNSFRGTFLFPLIFLAMGIISVTLGLVACYSLKNENKSNQQYISQVQINQLVPTAPKN